MADANPIPNTPVAQPVFNDNPNGTYWIVYGAFVHQGFLLFSEDNNGTPILMGRSSDDSCEREDCPVLVQLIDEPDPNAEAAGVRLTFAKNGGRWTNVCGMRHVSSQFQLIHTGAAGTSTHVPCEVFREPSYYSRDAYDIGADSETGEVIVQWNRDWWQTKINSQRLPEHSEHAMLKDQTTFSCRGFERHNAIKNVNRFDGATGFIKGVEPRFPDITPVAVLSSYDYDMIGLYHDRNQDTLIIKLTAVDNIENLRFTAHNDIEYIYNANETFRNNRRT